MSEDLQGVLLSEKSKVQMTVTSYISIRLPHIKKNGTISLYSYLYKAENPKRLHKKLKMVFTCIQ